MRARLLPTALILMLAACQSVTDDGLPTSATPQPRPDRPRPAVQAAPSDESVATNGYYARLQQRLLSEGLLRQDDGETDAAFGAAELARDFERIALFSEYVQVGGRYIPQQSAAQLRRWEQPVRIELHFGASVSQAVQRDDTESVQAYVARLRRLTGHPIDLVASGGNYHVFVADVDEQRALGPAISAAEPGLSRSTVREITQLDRATYCAVYASSSPDRPNVYVSAIAYIRSEHPDLMRQACYHEEIAQGLGLANDSPEARPSIFNDDEEFALLTRHDELLLRMLYDPRLSVGMSAEQARPIVRVIAGELVGAGPV